MRLAYPFVAALLLPGQLALAAPPAAGECVVLLHGLGRTHRSMSRLAQAAQAVGYKTVNLDYASRGKTIEALAAEVVPAALKRCGDAHAWPVNFVTHSMGGIVVRYYLEKHRVSELGRVVMLSPPNQGSEAADALRDDTIYKWWNGPAGQELGTGPDGIAARLGPVNYPVGIITGTVHTFYDAQRARLIPGPNDGKVSVERAKVSGMSDFLALPVTHTFIMNDGDVVSQVLHFLQHGRFRR